MIHDLQKITLLQHEDVLIFALSLHLNDSLQANYLSLHNDEVFGVLRGDLKKMELPQLCNSIRLYLNTGDIRPICIEMKYSIEF